MTDIELLPLPKWMSTFIVPDEGKEVGCDHRLSALMKDYARACAEHATAPLRAHRDRLTLHVLDLEADRSGLIGACDSYRRRAERLAEALRELVALGHPRDPAIIAAKNALRDHDQEVGNG